MMREPSYRSFLSVSNMATLNMDDIIRLIEMQAEARREEANQQVGDGKKGGD